MELKDERFGLNDWLLGVQLGQALDYGASPNFFPIAYKGFDIGDPWLDNKMIAWIQEQLEDKTQTRQITLKHWWSEAMADRYGTTPPEVLWANDPIVKRLKPALAASLHDEILRMEMQASAARAKK
jgi:hypothetical protein